MPNNYESDRFKSASSGLNGNDGKMIRWLIRAGLVVVIVAVSLIWGNLEALGVALLIATVAVAGGRRRRSFRVALVSAWSITVVLTVSVWFVGAGPRTATRREMVFRLYDLNCNALPGTYRYPRDVVWLADERPFYGGSWNRVLVCESWIK
jgi:hypothetical protein